MIPTKANDREHQAYVRNIISTFESATEDQRRRGLAWYQTAHDIADMATDGFASIGAGVIAALSPLTDWDTNVMLAVDAIEAGTITRGHFRDACSKVNRILAGVDPEEVLPMTMKTGMFYRCIADPTDPDAVVIDRHAHDVAVGKKYSGLNRGLSNANRYATLAHAYREAARKVGELPQSVQAVCWVVWTEKKES